MVGRCRWSLALCKLEYSVASAIVFHYCHESQRRRWPCKQRIVLSTCNWAFSLWHLNITLIISAMVSRGKALAAKAYGLKNEALI